MITHSAPHSQIHQDDCLSWGDSFFLYLERDGQPLSIASISEFEGRIPLKACMQFIESKLPQIPRYRQRVVFPPFNVGLPVWEYDPHFDIRNHMREAHLKQGTEAELKQMVSQILSTALSREHPLWDFTFIRGLKGNRTAVLARVHHCLADGIAGVRLMNVIMDTTPTPPPSRKAEVFQAPPPTDSTTLLLDGLFRSYFSVVERVLKVQSEVLGAAQKAMSSAGDSQVNREQGKCAPEGPAIPGLMELVSEMSMPAEKLPFNIVCQGPHQMGWTQISLSAVKEIKKMCGTTVNNVILAVLTAAVAKYAKLHGTRLTGRTLRVVVPINIRTDEDQEGLGNRITFLPVSFPLDLQDPVKLLATVHQKMCFYRSAKVPELVSLAGTLLGAIPTTLQAILAPMVSQLPLSLLNMICTNVPGPQMPLYLMGHKMTRWYPVVPIGGLMGVNCAVLSYDGNVFFGFHAAANAVPDVERMEAFLQESFAELCELTVGSQMKKAKAAKKPLRRRKPIPAAKAKQELKRPMAVSASTRAEEAEAVAASEKVREIARAVVA